MASEDNDRSRADAEDGDKDITEQPKISGNGPAIAESYELQDASAEKTNTPKPFSGNSPEEAAASDAPETSGLALLLLMTGLLLAAFTMGIDRTIVATAAPSISDEFSSAGDIGWYGSSYLLTACAFQPTWGRVFAHFDIKWSFITSMVLFELGSLVSGVAPSSSALIVGRAIAGLGCAGVLAGAFAVIAAAVPLNKRPVYISLLGST